MHRTVVILALLGATTVSAAPVSSPSAWTLYTAKLSHQCGAKHLHWLSEIDLRDYVDDFQTSLPGDEQHTMNAYRERSCRGVKDSTRCDADGFLAAAVKLNELDHFVDELCAQPMHCTHQAICSEGQP